MSERGMKKWAPFSSLIEQSTCLEKMRYERNKVDKPSISSDRANKINEILKNYHGQEIRIKYYYDGYLFEIKTSIIKIESTKRALLTSKGIIPLSNIIDVIDDTLF